ncbi:hypothetical protein J3458_001781 [Metarhizium acridum]|uniref:uncharacterized protein n=1 Tax=Metarhizium acridum TaxID=92637 RepID=UPI001C6CBE29|nr:hypothetical protein J3458_001781 [Metarhizium acridum]
MQNCPIVHITTPTRYVHGSRNRQRMLLVLHVQYANTACTALRNADPITGVILLSSTQFPSNPLKNRTRLASVRFLPFNRMHDLTIPGAPASLVSREKGIFQN